MKKLLVCEEELTTKLHQLLKLQLVVTLLDVVRYCHYLLRFITRPLKTSFVQLRFLQKAQVFTRTDLPTKSLSTFIDEYLELGSPLRSCSSLFVIQLNPLLSVPMT